MEVLSSFANQTLSLFFPLISYLQTLLQAYVNIHLDCPYGFVLTLIISICLVFLLKCDAKWGYNLISPQKIDQLVPINPLSPTASKLALIETNVYFQIPCRSHGSKLSAQGPGQMACSLPSALTSIPEPTPKSVLPSPPTPPSSSSPLSAAE